MTDPERRTQPSRARQEQARADWLRHTLERAPRPLSQATRRRLSALLAPFGDHRNEQLPAGSKTDAGGSHEDHHGVTVGRINAIRPGSGRGDGV